MSSILGSRAPVAGPSPRRWHPVTGALLVLLAGLLVIPVGIAAGWAATGTVAVAFTGLGLVAGFAVSGST